ncbi:MAG: TOBE domain-containing protein, partial [Marinosulfonomonas sp.]|nr:TOBE domain-containing protein [Marinosulfonomonas sp.]
KIVQVATPDRLYETPNSVYVADFIGDINLFEGTAHAKGDRLVEIHWAEGEKPVLGEVTSPIPDGTKCHFAIRPEKVAISRERPKGHANVVQGQVHDIAYLGNISTYHVQLKNGQIVKAQTANNRRISRRSFTWEDPVWLSWTDTAGVILTR